MAWWNLDPQIWLLANHALGYLVMDFIYDFVCNDRGNYTSRFKANVVGIPQEIFDASQYFLDFFVSFCFIDFMFHIDFQ